MRVPLKAYDYVNNISSVYGIFKRNEVQQLEAENKKLIENIKQINKDYGFEIRDPNGTIWNEAKRLQEENKKLKATQKPFATGVERFEAEIKLFGVDSALEYFATPENVKPLFDVLKEIEE